MSSHVLTAPRVRSRRRGGSTLRTAGTWAYRSALMLAVGVAVFATVVPWLVQHSGTRLVTITSGSMAPLFPVGSTVAVHEAADPDALEPGQIITFTALGNGTVITHRIVARVERASLPGVHYRTKGDANNTADPDLAPASHVIAVADGVLPQWQGTAVSLQTPQGRLLVYGSLFLLIALGELLELGSMWRRRRATA